MCQAPFWADATADSIRLGAAPRLEKPCRACPGPHSIGATLEPTAPTEGLSPPAAQVSLGLGRCGGWGDPGARGLSLGLVFKEPQVNKGENTTLFAEPPKDRAQQIPHLKSRLRLNWRKRLKQSFVEKHSLGLLGWREEAVVWEWQTAGARGGHTAQLNPTCPRHTWWWWWGGTRAFKGAGDITSQSRGQAGNPGAARW